MQRELVAAHQKLRPKWVRNGYPRAGRGKGRRPTRIKLGHGADRDGNAQFGILGDAGVRASKPACVSRERKFASGLQIGRRLDRHREKNVVLVAVVHDGAIGETFRCRPHDWPRLEAPRQGPINRRRQARVAWVRPVRVPTRRNLLPERQM